MTARTESSPLFGLSEQAYLPKSETPVLRAADEIESVEAPPLADPRSPRLGRITLSANSIDDLKRIAHNVAEAIGPRPGAATA